MSRNLVLAVVLMLTGAAWIGTAAALDPMLWLPGIVLVGVSLLLFRREVATEPVQPPIEDLMEQMGARGPRERTDTTAQELQLAFVDLDHLTIAPEALRCIPAYLARGRLVMPVKRDGHILWIAVGDVNDVDTMDRVREFSGCRVIPVVVERDALERAVQRYYPIR